VSFEAAAAILRETKHLLISAGAGMGVDSGLPDFRGNAGFWQAYPPYQKLGLSFVDLANPVSFDRDPELGWGFYGHRLELYRNTKPHQGFEILRRWAAAKESHFVFTSNVDGHFQRAGFADDRVYEVHGSIHFLQCSLPCRREVLPEAGLSLGVDLESMRATAALPACPECRRVARPNILMFGDGRWINDRSMVQEDHFGRWLERVGESPLAIIELGAGTAVPSVRMQSEELVRHSDAKLIRINPRQPEVPPGQIGLAVGSLEALSAIDALLRA
jgi:NAD-dependent SIR2 family protein deacetylase